MNLILFYTLSGVDILLYFYFEEPDLRLCMKLPLHSLLPSPYIENPSSTLLLIAHTRRETPLDGWRHLTANIPF